MPIAFTPRGLSSFSSPPSTFHALAHQLPRDMPPQPSPAPKPPDTLPPVPPVPGAVASAPPPSSFRRAARSGVAAWLGLLLPPLLLLGLLLANILNHDALRAAVHHLSPGCFFHRLTGISCPGCGGTRALIALIDGHPLAALRHNWLWLPTALILLEEYLLSLWLRLHPEQENLRFARPRLLALRLYALIVVLWFPARNILGI